MRGAPVKRVQGRSIPRLPVLARARAMARRAWAQCECRRVHQQALPAVCEHLAGPQWASQVIVRRLIIQIYGLKVGFALPKALLRVTSIQASFLLLRICLTPYLISPPTQFFLSDLLVINLISPTYFVRIVKVLGRLLLT